MVICPRLVLNDRASSYTIHCVTMHSVRAVVKRPCIFFTRRNSMYGNHETRCAGFQDWVDRHGSALKLKKCLNKANKKQDFFVTR